MSSALLYLAIVAIWALVLVPRWVRPRHSAPRATASRQILESHLTEPAWPRRVEDFAWAHEDEDGREGPGQDGEASQDGEAGPEVGAGEVAARHGAGAAGPGWSVPGQRASILRARRRALIALLLLTGGAVAIAVRHLAADWVVAPPAALLAGFMLVLRAAARSDARRAADIAARWRSAPAAGQPARVRTAVVPAQPEVDTEPGAQIIDISARVADQVYDQYADAAIRAVGD